jgi:uncharacterized damage-inducible protein DinB
MMNKAQLVEAIQRARAEWDALLARVPPAGYEQPGAAGTWTLKDVIAHLAWHEREVAQALQARDFTNSSDWWLLPTDERNRRIYEAHREIPLAKVIAEAHLAYTDLLAAVQSLSEDELNDASRFTNHPPDAAPWEIVAQNSYEHYQDHMDDLRSRLV